MNKSLICPKCNSRNIVKSKVGLNKGNYVIQTGSGFPVVPTAYICCECGYIENYIEKQKDFEKIQKAFKD